MGEAKYMGLYSVGAITGLGLIVWGYKKAPIGEFIYTGGVATPTVNMGLMVVAFILMVASQLPAGFIKSKLKHPMLLAVILWAISHLIDGADFKQFLLFGSFLVFSVVDIIVASMRTSGTNKVAISTIGNSMKFDVLAVVFGLLGYFIVAQWLHTGITVY
jgi:uncharacterized membrane protein